MRQTIPLKRLVDPGRPITYGIVQAGEDVVDGVPYIRPVDMDGHRGVNPGGLRTTSPKIASAYTRSKVTPGDIVVSIGPSFGKTMVVPAELEGANLTQGTARVAVRPDVDARYVVWALQAQTSVDFWESSIGGATFRALNLGPLKETPIPLPSPEQQRAIAAYLDHETARIDTLIIEQRRLVALLVDRRRAILDEVASSATGNQIRLRFLFAPSSEANHPQEAILSVYRDYGVILKSSRDDNFNRTPENVDRYLLVRPGDLVVNRMKAWQGSLGISSFRGIVSGDYEVARSLTDRLLPGFAHLFLRSPKMIAEYAIRSTGVRPSQWRLYWDQMGNIEVPLPSHDEQIAIVARMDEQTKKIDALIVETEHFIKLAAERRSALVTAAVTGQIDVRAVA